MLRRWLRDKQWTRQVPWQRHASAIAGIRQRALETSEVNDGTTSIEAKRRRGRPRKQVEIPIIELKRKPGPPRKAAETSQTPATKLPSSAPRKGRNDVPMSLISQASQHHHDLPSFLSYATRTELSISTTVYKGTHYEYTAASALASYGFTLHRTGRANDLGIDLVGTFTLPSSKAKKKRVGRPKKSATSTSAADLQVIVQCKAVKPQPSMVRELEGAYVGAPAGWKGDNVLALLVASGPATKGVRDSLQRSRLPMALLQITAEGWVRQFLWNAAAAAIGLEGLGVTLRHGGAADHSIALTWLGKVVKAA